MAWTTPRTWADNELVTAALLNTHLRDNLNYLYGCLPTRATLWFDECTITAGGGSLTDLLNTAQPYLTVPFISTGTDGDKATWSVVLAAGTYTFSVLGATSLNRGKADWTIEGTTITTGQDWYSAATVYAVIQTATVVIPTGGLLTLTLTMNGKNAASSAYYISLTKMWFKQASD